jgi:hypothetical protein
MWPSEEEVTCIACGSALERSAAREYDKHGDRWEREGKSFEYLCKPCFRGLSKAKRGDLESALVAAGAGECSREEFLNRYLDAAGADQ